MGGRLDMHDRFRDWRLDVDHMSYEVSSSQSNFHHRFFNPGYLILYPIVICFYNFSIVA